jgi:hypothetical protein
MGGASRRSAIEALCRNFAGPGLGPQGAVPRVHRGCSERPALLGLVPSLNHDFHSSVLPWLLEFPEEFLGHSADETRRALLRVGGQTPHLPAGASRSGRPQGAPETGRASKVPSTPAPQDAPSIVQLAKQAIKRPCRWRPRGLPSYLRFPLTTTRITITVVPEHAVHDALHGNVNFVFEVPAPHP